METFLDWILQQVASQPPVNVNPILYHLGCIPHNQLLAWFPPPPSNYYIYTYIYIWLCSNLHVQLTSFPPFGRMYLLRSWGGGSGPQVFVETRGGKDRPDICMDHELSAWWSRWGWQINSRRLEFRVACFGRMWVTTCNNQLVIFGEGFVDERWWTFLYDPYAPCMVSSPLIYLYIYPYISTKCR